MESDFEISAEIKESYRIFVFYINLKLAVTDATRLNKQNQMLQQFFTDIFNNYVKSFNL